MIRVVQSSLCITNNKSWNRSPITYVYTYTECSLQYPFVFNERGLTFKRLPSVHVAKYPSARLSNNGTCPGKGHMVAIFVDPLTVCNSCCCIINAVKGRKNNVEMSNKATLRTRRFINEKNNTYGSRHERNIITKSDRRLMWLKHRSHATRK